jgi:acyl-CoA synthetase (AMP-forming)/AMP-acid ligase II
MLHGLMQDHPLTIQHILDRMKRVYGDSEVVTLKTPAGEKTRTTYAQVGERVDRLCNALETLGVGPGDRVATFAWNTQEHLELYMGVPCMGAVLHTLNIRLFPDQLTYIANHAEDKLMFVSDSLVPVLEKLAPTFETVEQYVVIGDGDAGSLPNVVRYEEMLAEQSSDYEYPALDERAGAGLCYTSGTTGNPKGVLYSHRSNLLHAMGACMSETLAISTQDRVLPVVPMFHANAWGLPYACTMVGADLVMPGPFLQAEPLANLITQEQITFAGAVPTIWMDLLRYADEHKPDLSSLTRVVCGGAAVPEALMRGFEERHDVKIVQAWGMTETSPLGAVAWPPKLAEGEDEWRYRTATGRISPGVEIRIVDDDGNEVEWDGEKTGEIEIRGSWIASDYYNDPSGAEKFDRGWLRTGDIASIDSRGYIRISDRAKDVIKSGGEWISSVELENHLMAHPDVLEAAVIAKPDERWSERPLACVVLREGASCTPDALLQHLTPLVAKWWLPDEFAFIDEVPKTSVGKFDKKVLRQRLAEGKLEQGAPVEAP